MKYLVLVSHGGLAEGVQSSLKMFAGDKTDQIIAVGLKEGKSVDDFGFGSHSWRAESDNGAHWACDEGYAGRQRSCSDDSFRSDSSLTGV